MKEREKKVDIKFNFPFVALILRFTLVAETFLFSLFATHKSMYDVFQATLKALLRVYLNRNVTSDDDDNDNDVNE